ncbi:MAG TPA: guanylate kinase [Patescibacteria group bacterium]|nr:guanylate kinase [Patescibacteria group bacterium]
MSLDDIYQRPRYPLLIVISGPSGVGKDAVAKELLRSRDSLSFVVTATSRPPRPGEVPGRDYIFFSPDEFERRIARNEFLEHAVVYGEYKGVLKEQIQKAIDSDQDVIMRVDVQGAATLRGLVPNAVFIFITAESEKVLEYRLNRRKSDPAEALELRIASAHREMRRVGEFDYCVVNVEDCLDETVQLILTIIDAEHQRVDQSPIAL